MPVGVQCPISSSLGEFPSYWEWLWCPGLSPVLMSIALFYSALAGVGPWHLAAADVATRLPRTPPFSRLLRQAGGYSRTILTPTCRGDLFDRLQHIAV